MILFLSCEIKNDINYFNDRSTVYCMDDKLTMMWFILQPVASVVSSVDSSPSPDSVHTKDKTPDVKTKTPDQPKQQKPMETAVKSSVGEPDSVVKGLEVDEMIERIDNTIAPLIVGSDPTDQKTVDEILQ